VLATRATVASEIYEREFYRRLPTVTVRTVAASLLVPLVEEGWIDAPETASITAKYTEPLRESGVDTVVLGCTHFPLLASHIRAAMGAGVTVVDPAAAVARAVRERLDRDATLASACRGLMRTVAVTDRTPHFERIAREWLGVPIALECVAGL
jgi:glutamate racemase